MYPTAQHARSTMNIIFSGERERGGGDERERTFDLLFICSSREEEEKMYHSLFVICLLINQIATDNHPCSSVNKKFNHLGIPIPHHPVSGLRICQGLVQDICCPQVYEDKLQNITAMELYQLFELHSMNLHERLIRLNVQYNGLYFSGEKNTTP